MKKYEYIAQDIIKTAKERELRDNIIKFFKKNQNPKDSELHEWVEKNKYNVHEVETEIYKFATFFVNFYADGRANKEGFKESDADPKELAMGIEVEYEHTTDKGVSKRIALDHLSELSDYYTRLAKMESEGKKEKKK